MIIKYLLLFTLVLGAQPEMSSKTSDEIFTIYLIRHAEKDLLPQNSSDPELTECGQKRAESIRLFFDSVSLDKVYSTNYIRTKNTAQPTAASKKLDITLYDSERLEDLAKRLIENQEDALVVGHSNTTAVLAGLLVGEELRNIDLDVYDQIYQVVISRKSGKLQLFHSAFECSD
jgi:broad specificity phosphatase PhoE